MRILIVTPHVFAGGAEKVALNLARELNDLGSKASICTLSLDLRYLSHQFKHLDYILPDSPIPRSTIGGVKEAIRLMMKETYVLMELLRRCASNYDVVNPCNVPAYWASYLSRNSSPSVWTCSEVFGPYDQTRDIYLSSRIFRWSLSWATALDRYVVRKGVDEIVTYSEFNKRLVTQHYGKTSHVIHGGLDYPFFGQKIPNAVEKIGVKGHPILLQVGALVKRKNQIVSIRALKSIKKKRSRAKLIIVGSGPWREVLQDEVKNLGLEEDVLFTGSVSEEMLKLLYNACDINLYPVQDQTWGLVPFEALAAGKPSIVSKDSGAGEVIQEKGIGYTLTDISPEGLVEAVEQVLKSYDEYLDKAAQGREYVSENLSCKAYAKKMQTFFKKVLDKSRLAD